jgi:hypothetical protein
MYKPLLILILMPIFIILLNSSGQTSTKQNEASDLTIKAGYICGWGAGQDTLIITKKKVSYVFYVPQKSNKPRIKKSRPTTEKEWKELLSSFDLNAFLKLNYNTCNVCIDGCDDWISIQSKDINHRISFNYGMQIDTIKNLQEKLSQISAEFQNF